MIKPEPTSPLTIRRTRHSIDLGIHDYVRLSGGRSDFAGSVRLHESHVKPTPRRELGYSQALPPPTRNRSKSNYMQNQCDKSWPWRIPKEDLIVAVLRATSIFSFISATCSRYRLAFAAASPPVRPEIIFEYHRDARPARHDHDPFDQGGEDTNSREWQPGRDRATDVRVLRD